MEEICKSINLPSDDVSHIRTMMELMGEAQKLKTLSEMDVAG